MRAMAGAAIAAGICILVLMFAATILSVAFATRGAMATNKAVIEVLHFVGAKNGFIARHFQHHFLVLGLQGGAIGGGAAIVTFLAATLISHWFIGGDQGSALFGSFSIGLVGYAAVLVQVVLIAIVTAWTSRHTVNSTLETID
jgi:cell division transport system permease protein